MTTASDWPEDAACVGPAEVVVCHHVAYNIPRLDAFVTELSAYARVRVVMELSEPPATKQPGSFEGARTPSRDPGSG